MLQRNHVQTHLFDKMYYWFDSLPQSKNSKKAWKSNGMGNLAQAVIGSAQNPS